MEKKIRVTVNKSAFDIIESDVQSFKITKNYLINYIFDILKEEKIETFHQDEEKKEIIQFNLNKKNKNNMKRNLKLSHKSLHIKSK